MGLFGYGATIPVYGYISLISATDLLISQIINVISNGQRQLIGHKALVYKVKQFSPFAALTGYEREVKEAARLTEKRIELSSEQKEILNEQLRLLEDGALQGTVASFTFFKPDDRKDGGAYVTVAGRIKKIDLVERNIILLDGTIVPIDALYQIYSEA